MKKITKILCATFVLLALESFALSPAAQAVSPAPDGGYPGGNTAEGQAALLNLTTGGFNTAIGFASLRSDTTNSFNTAIGAAALFLNAADENTATGAGALLSNTTGDFNTANGSFALSSNTTGNNNTAIGRDALFHDTTGNSNTAIGRDALFSDADGGNNTAIGREALLSNVSGSGNVAIGRSALGISTSDVNTAVGEGALNSDTTGTDNVALGYLAGSAATTGSNNVYVGAQMHGMAGESNACYIASIFGQTSVNGVPVLINTDNKLGTTTSSKRFKEDIKPMDNGSEALFSLKPVRFRYKKDLDPSGTQQFGLVAEEVEKVNPDLIVRDKEGKPYSVRYEMVNAMLLNEFLKEHKAFVEEKRKVQELESNAVRQQKQIETLTAGLQKVSAQLETSGITPQVVVNER